MTKRNPCLTCGACCAHYLVTFYWAEGSDAGGQVPVELTVDIDHSRRAMRGTTDKSCTRCVALDGIVGFAVRCSIFGYRPSLCGEFPASWADGQQHELCDRARLAKGLELLTPDAWDDEPTNTPELPLAA